MMPDSAAAEPFRTSSTTSPPDSKPQEGTTAAGNPAPMRISSAAAIREIPLPNLTSGPWR